MQIRIRNFIGSCFEGFYWKIQCFFLENWLAFIYNFGWCVQMMNYNLFDSVSREEMFICFCLHVNFSISESKKSNLSLNTFNISTDFSRNDIYKRAAVIFRKENFFICFNDEMFIPITRRFVLFTHWFNGQYSDILQTSERLTIRSKHLSIWHQFLRVVEMKRSLRCKFKFRIYWTSCYFVGMERVWNVHHSRRNVYENPTTSKTCCFLYLLMNLLLFHFVLYRSELLTIP